MKRGRKPQDVTPDPGQFIGHISVPIEDNDLARVQAVLKRHGVELRKIQTPDNWWLLLFPGNALKTKQRTEGRVTTSTVQLPDGYCFLFEEASFNHDKTYATLPRVFVEEELGDVQR